MASTQPASAEPPDTVTQGKQLPSSNLKHVFLLFRHGKRAPIPPLPPNVKDTEIDWPTGFCNLTATGKAQMYEMGQHFRKVYSSFLSDDPREVFAMSRVVPRCFESAAIFLAGMYPPKQNWIWNDELHWQPIQIISEQPRFWPYRDLSEDEVRMLSELKAPSPHKTAIDLFEFILTKFGLEKDLLNQVEPILHYFMCRKEHGYPIPSWAQENYEALSWALDLCHDIKCTALMVPYAQDSLTLVSYTLKKKFFSTENGGVAEKLTVYGFSDINLTGILKILGSNIVSIPPFGATMAIEVFSGTKDDDLNVRILYIPDIKKDPKLVKLSRCENPCSLKEFLKVIELETV